MSSPNATPNPFAISIPEADLAALRSRLASTRFPNSFALGWPYGSPDIEDVKRLVARWRDGYDWRKYEKELNEKLPQFTVDIVLNRSGTVNIHFVHKRSKVENAIPLLFIHGWPGSFLEVSKILPLLTESADTFPSFHVVTFSLPGFGFSQGCELWDHPGKLQAEIGHQLMQILGYKQYVTQGGGWGYTVTRQITQMYGGPHCRATHTNISLEEPHKLLKNPKFYIKSLFKPYTLDEMWRISHSTWCRDVRYPFYDLQDTQQETIKYVLTDSPVGLLTWIYEKLLHWTDHYPWTDDEILTWISIYWFSRAGPADSLHVSYEATECLETASKSKVPSDVAVGISMFRNDFTLIPKIWGRTIVPKIVFRKSHLSGGHFAAHEKPEELVNDLRIMFGRGGPAFGVVEGHTGY